MCGQTERALLRYMLMIERHELSHIWREKLRKESIEPCSWRIIKTTSERKKRYVFGARNDVMLTDGRNSNYLIAALLFFFFLIKELALKVGGGKHNYGWSDCMEWQRATPLFLLFCIFWKFYSGSIIFLFYLILK